jgi:hypothetical protein
MWRRFIMPNNAADQEPTIWKFVREFAVN